MKKNHLYIIGGIIAILIIIGIFSPDAEKAAFNNTAKDVQIITNTDSVLLAPDITETSITPSKFYSVVSVVDGDTIKLNMDGKTETFRLIRIETDATQGTYDKYNRLLGYIYREDGLFYNKYMIEQGYAHEYTYNTAYKYQTGFKNAQKEAQANKAGLWSPSTCNGDTTKTSTTNSTQTNNADSCTIKGNIGSSKEKIFHVVGCGSYNKTVIDESKGEKWFCSEKEAIDAGCL